MSEVYVVERGWVDPFELPFGIPSLDYDVLVRDPNGRDGEWYAVVSLPYESVERDGYAVPAFEGDVERIEWERRRR